MLRGSPRGLGRRGRRNLPMGSDFARIIPRRLSASNQERPFTTCTAETFDLLVGPDVLGQITTLGCHRSPLRASVCFVMSLSTRSIRALRNLGASFGAVSQLQAARGKSDRSRRRQCAGRSVCSTTRIVPFEPSFRSPGKKRGHVRWLQESDGLLNTTHSTSMIR
jgi:hypothetical protein